MTRPESLRVGVLGAGTVGGPVVSAFLDWPERLAPFDGLRLTLAGVADRFMDRVIARGVPADLVTDAPAHLVADPDVDVIVELMGGDEPARTLIAAALAAGKAVVTANKHVVAHHGPELEAIARERGGTFRFEAAVGGGTPVLTPLAEGLAADEIRRVRGIVNGTTNFILTSMREQGGGYLDVLAEAQARGYAEADPRGDVEGDDAVNKVVILARLAFDAWLAPADVRTSPPTMRGTGRAGITGVTAAEVAAAAALGLTLKLVAIADRRACWPADGVRPPERGRPGEPPGTNGRGREPDRDRGGPGWNRRVHRPGRRGRGDLVGRARRPHRARPWARQHLGGPCAGDGSPAACPRRRGGGRHAGHRS